MPQQTVVDQILADKDASAQSLVAAARKEIAAGGGHITNSDGVRCATWNGDLLNLARSVWGPGFHLLRSHPETVRFQLEMRPFLSNEGHMKELRPNQWFVSWRAEDDPSEEADATDPPSTAAPEITQTSTTTPEEPTVKMAVCPECGDTDSAVAIRTHIQKLRSRIHPKDGHRRQCQYCPAVKVHVDSWLNHLQRNHKEHCAGLTFCKACATEGVPAPTAEDPQARHYLGAWFSSRAEYARHMAVIHGATGRGFPTLVSREEAAARQNPPSEAPSAPVEPEIVEARPEETPELQQASEAKSEPAQPATEPAPVTAEPAPITAQEPPVAPPTAPEIPAPRAATPAPNPAANSSVDVDQAIDYLGAVIAELNRLRQRDAAREDTERENTELRAENAELRDRLNKVHQALGLPPVT